MTNEFYLHSHAGLIGTAKPTQYTILADENDFRTDEIQRLTNNRSFVFSRATRSVVSSPPSLHCAYTLPCFVC